MENFGTLSFTSAPPLILVVDDDEDVRDALTDALADAGYRARGVSAWGALDLARRERPALLLLDIHMPGLDGPTLCRRLRETHGAGLPVVFHSGLPGFLAAPLAIDCAPWGWLPKPCDLDELLTTVRRHVPSP